MPHTHLFDEIYTIYYYLYYFTQEESCDQPL